MRRGEVGEILMTVSSVLGAICTLGGGIGWALNYSDKEYREKREDEKIQQYVNSYMDNHLKIEMNREPVGPTQFVPNPNYREI